LDSWDEFLIPYPGARGVFIWGEPLWVPRDLSGEAIEMKRRELEERLLHLNKQAVDYFDLGGPYVLQGGK
jgi:lysophospholipid acyltransferase (LPLAT)-like uncharacterized protein